MTIWWNYLHRHSIFEVLRKEKKRKRGGVNNRETTNKIKVDFKRKVFK